MTNMHGKSLGSGALHINNNITYTLCAWKVLGPTTLWHWVVSAFSQKVNHSCLPQLLWYLIWWKWRLFLDT